MDTDVSGVVFYDIILSIKPMISHCTQKKKRFWAKLDDVFI